MNVITPYKTIKRGKSPICPKPTTLTSIIKPQHKRSIIHVLSNADSNGDRRDATEQTIPSYGGFHASLNRKQGKNMAYFHTSYNQLPNKSFVDDIMKKLSKIIITKHMPLAFHIGNIPVYVLITLLKTENPSKDCVIVPFLVSFNTQCAMMGAIYKHFGVS